MLLPPPASQATSPFIFQFHITKDPASEKCEVCPRGSGRGRERGLAQVEKILFLPKIRVKEI